MFVGFGPRFAATALSVTIAVTGLAAAGCSGSSDQPRTLPPLSTTPAATDSPVSPPSKQADLAAATAVVRQYFRLLNAPTTAQNAAALEALMTRKCSCRRVADSTRRIAKRGEHYFGTSKVISVTPALDSPNAAEVLVEYDYTSGGIKRKDGKVVTQTPGRKGNLLNFGLVRRDDRWLIQTVVTVRNGRPE